MNEESIDTKLNYSEYLINEYGISWPVLFGPIEDFANVQSLFSDNRKFLLTQFGYTEASIEFDEGREMMRSYLRSKKHSPFLKDEMWAFIRLCVLVTMFDREIPKSPDNDKDFREFCLNHPLWPRIEKQAQKTLELFKKNKYKREVPI